MDDQICRLRGVVQHYAWGGFDFIPNFLRLLVKENIPYAEYWLGAHPSAPSDVELPDGTSIFLDAAIKQLPLKFLGEEVYNRFGELPYLLKVLDVSEMLSIQVHPGKEEAGKGYDREELEGVLLDAPHRNYKDRNHKPEVMVALSDFWLLHGFKPHEDLLHTLQHTPGFGGLLNVYEQSGYYGLYKHVMEMPQQEANELLSPLVEDAFKSDYQKHEPGYWVKKMYKGKMPSSAIDRGIFSIYFFNIVNVKPGEGIFQQAGVPHAYLEGQNIELMANSDNVLRGGLTPKHIDVPELLKHTKFEGIIPKVLRGELAHEVENCYNCPVQDFGLTMVKLSDEKNYSSSSYSAEIILVTEGAVTAGGKEFISGEAFLLLPGTDYTAHAKVDSVFFKAFVPKLSAEKQTGEGGISF